MALPIRKPLSIQKPTTVGRVTVKPLVKSTLAVFDIPIEDLVESSDNPNEQDEATFDQLVQVIKTKGFDEPIKVVPLIGRPGKYLIYSGHHRVKAAKLLKMTVVPAVINEGWTEDERKIALVRENQMRGQLNPEKFTKLFMEMRQKGYDENVLKLQMGFTKEEAFKKIYQNVAKNLNPAQKKQLDAAKERITSVDGLSSVLNDIFREHGSDLDHGFIVFSFAGKQHHYVECDKQLHQMMQKFEEECKTRKLFAPDVFKELLTKVDLSKHKASTKVDTRKANRTEKS